MKKWIITILVIIILIAILVTVYVLSQNNSGGEENESEEIKEDGTLEIGTTEQRGFIIDNIYHSENQGDIHFASYYPNGYDMRHKIMLAI